MRASLLALALLLAVAPARGQDDPRVRPVLAGERAAIVFSPDGGYAPENYLKRFAAGPDAQPTWASQGGALVELIRRCPPDGEVRIATFKLGDRELEDALFAAARRGVRVKLWLKGPPGLTYMVDGHRAIAARANDYLRERAAAGQRDVWGDFEVQLGTAEQMHAFGKVNDMHQKFGIVGLRRRHAPGYNDAFLGTSNLGRSSDTYHNENRVYFHEDPKVAQRLWQEFDRLWTHLGRCETFTDGDPALGTNETPEGEPRIELGDGGFADEAEDDPVLVRFTYERRDGEFHRISQDFVDALDEARHLEPGAEVWLAQFGFGIASIGRALERAARRSPEVTFHVIVHMAEADSYVLQRLLDARLPNLDLRVKWDSNTLIIEPGTSPRVPGPTDPGPSLLHHKTLVVGDRVLLTGSFNFFSDADDQGEDVAIVRPRFDPAYAPLLEDTAKEMAALVASGVTIDARRLFGEDGLFQAVETASAEPGFSDLLRLLGPEPRRAHALRKALAEQGEDLSQDEVDALLDVLVRFDFAERDAAGRVRRREAPDGLAFRDKADVRARAAAAAAAAPAAGSPAPGTGSGLIGGIEDAGGD